MVTALILVLAHLCMPGCGPDEDAAGLVPVAQFVPISPETPLDSVLLVLESELAAATSEQVGPEEEMMRLTRAEALTDRLLEPRLPFQRLRDGYRLDARLRQIQALGDRMLAQLRTGAPHDSLMADARALRQDVIQLRTEIRQGGAPERIPLDRLLESQDTKTVALPGLSR
jgi:hypothetical protein